MAERKDEFHRTGGTADPGSNPTETRGPDAVHNPDETRRGNKPGQLQQEAERSGPSEPSTGSGAPGWSDRNDRG
jgi:hypothetical protein